MTKGIIYYTDCLPEEPILPIVQKYILEAGLPIVSVSLNKPINFGHNFVLYGQRGYPMMVDQIVKALEESATDYIFFCEHDVLYHKSHFDFVPPRDDTYYYNANNWAWDYPLDRAVTNKWRLSLSGMCCHRVLALNHFKGRQAIMKEYPEEFVPLTTRRHSDSIRAKKWGYEPGTRRRKNGGYSDEKWDKWLSDFPNVDIRHLQTFSYSLISLRQMRRPPIDFVEVTLDKIPGWDLKKLFYR